MRAAKLQTAIDHLVSVVIELREADKGDDPGMCLGPYIEKQRSAWGLSLQGLADKCGCSKGHIWDIERGRAINPGAELIGRLAEALVVPPIHILNAALTTQRIERTANQGQGEGS